MGTSLSPLLAKLFMGIFERAIVDKLIKQGLILKWVRYVDDVLCILKTESKDLVFRKINEWDSQLKFTQTEMNSDGLIFLDCRLYSVESFILMKNFSLSNIVNWRPKQF